MEDASGTLFFRSRIHPLRASPAPSWKGVYCLLLTVTSLVRNSCIIYLRIFLRSCFAPGGMPLAPVYLSSISILPGIMFYTKHGRLHTLPRGKAVESTELQYASPLEALRQDFLLDKQHSTGTPKTMPIEKEVELTYRLQIKRRTLVRKDGDLHQMSPLWILLRAQSYPNKLDLF